MLSTSIEDYIKAIYAVEIEDHKASTKRVAHRLGVKMASVTGMIKHLAAEGYVRHKPYHGVQMTEKGRRVAVKMIRRHRIIELFLVRTLSLTWDEVDADAEILEHAVSDHLIERIYEHLGCPEFDPHGAPIPAPDEALPPRRGVPLDEVEEGVRSQVVEVSDREPAFLRYLTKLNINIGSEICVKRRDPFGGPVTLDLASSTVVIGREACARIRVTTQTKRKASARTKRP